MVTLKPPPGIGRTTEAAAPERQRDPERTRNEILEVATREFAERGYAGARVDEIAARMRTTKRMIYYYFGGKEQLFVAVLERAYAEIRRAEQEVDVDQLDPLAALRRIAELTFDHHESHPDFIRLVSIENIHRAAPHGQVGGDRQPRHAGDRRARADPRARPRGGRRSRREIDAVDLHMMISAFCVFRVANRHTFGTLFERDLVDPQLRDRYRAMLGDMVVDYVS